MTATLPGDGPVVGLIAHVDTSPDAPGAGVEPIVHRDHDGAPIELPRDGTVVEAPRRATTSSPPAATRCSAPTTRPAWPRSWPRSRTWRRNPDAPRPTLRVCFTPDEEIGEGATLFDVERFGAVCAYTLDGSDLGELQDETFSAEEVIVTIHGVDAHPGWAKDVLVNATRIAAEIVAALPRRAHARSAPRAATASSTSTSSRAAPGKAVDPRDRARLRRREAARRTPRCCARPPRRSSPATRARALEVEVTPQYPNMRRYIDALPAGRDEPPRRRSAPRASRSSARRSAAAPTAHG